MAKSKERKPARITVACNACRSRKQKCSGDKPICGQCLENNRPCDWPEQLRRGPAKGHVEALEHRLQVTEGVLLRLLSQVSDAQLSNAFPRDGAAVSRDSAGTYMPLARLDRRGIDEWSQFPLDNAQNIREWQHLLIGQSPVDSGTPPSKTDQSSVHRHQNSGVKRKHQEPGENGYQDTILAPGAQDYLPMVSLPHQQHERPSLSPVNTRPHLDQYWLSFEAAAKRSQMENKTGLSGPFDLPVGGQIEPQRIEPVQTSSNWEGAPSANFQQQFLW